MNDIMWLTKVWKTCTTKIYLYEWVVFLLLSYTLKIKLYVNIIYYFIFWKCSYTIYYVPISARNLNKYVFGTFRL